MKPRVQERFSLLQPKKSIEGLISTKSYCTFPTEGGNLGESNKDQIHYTAIFYIYECQIVFQYLCLREIIRLIILRALLTPVIF